MHKGKTLTVLLLILISLAGYYTYRQNSVLESADFNLKNTSVITKISIEQGENRLVLEKKDKQWYVNDTFPANQNLIKRFLKIFSNLNLVAPVSKSKQDSIKEVLKKSALKICIYNNSSKKYEYLLGELNAGKTGNYLLCNEHLGMLNSLGLFKNLKSIVSANSLFWRNKIIFNKQSSEIKNIAFYNIQKPEKSFFIHNKNARIELFDYQNNRAVAYDTSAVSRYLSYFQNIGFKQVEHNLSKQQLIYILKNNIAFRIELTDWNNLTYTLNLYFKPQNPLKNIQSTEYDLDLIYGKLNNEKDLLIFEYYDIDLILKEYSWFLPDSLIK